MDVYKYAIKKQPEINPPPPRKQEMEVFKHPLKKQPDIP